MGHMDYCPIIHGNALLPFYFYCLFHVPSRKINIDLAMSWGLEDYFPQKKPIFRVEFELLIYWTVCIYIYICILIYVCIYIYTQYKYIHIYIRHIIYIYTYGEYPITMVICGYSGESSHSMGKMGMFHGNTMGIAWVFGESS